MIRFANGTTLDTLGISGGYRILNGSNRDSISIKIINSDYPMIKDNFISENPFSVIEVGEYPAFDEEGNIMLDDEGNVIVRKLETVYDKSEYCIIGDIVDHGDGTFTVFVGKKTEHELEVEALYAAVDELLLEVLA